MDHYEPNEREILESTLGIDPDGLTSKKLSRIGVDIREEQKKANARLEELDREQPIQDK